MKHKILIVTSCLYLLTTIQSLAQKLEESISVNNQGVLFTENKGQVRDENDNFRGDILYSGHSNGLYFHVKKDGIQYQLFDLSEIDYPLKDNLNQISLDQELPTENKGIPFQRVDIKWYNVNPDLTLVGQNQVEGVINYLNVPVSQKPALCVKRYKSLEVKDVWPGINLNLYSKNGTLESDWYVHSPNDYSQIKFEIKGAEIKISEDGYLVLKTPLGEIREGALKVYQGEKLIPASWKIEKNGLVGFDIADYDPNIEIVIDPPTKLFGHLFGGDGSDGIVDSEVDDLGNICFGGTTQSLQNLATGGYQSIYGGGLYDAFAGKLNANGGTLWITYFGGESWDEALGIATGNQGRLYLFGKTDSKTGIAALNAYQPHKDTLGIYERFDAFFAVFDNSGNSLTASYYGGPGTDEIFDCVEQPNGSYVFVGRTNSSTGIVHNQAFVHQSQIGGGWDGFIITFNLFGLVRSTYFGGPGSDELNVVETDHLNRIIVAGSTVSATGISTPNSHQENHSGNLVNYPYDGFMAKFDESTILWSTYYGGNSTDAFTELIVDSVGDIYAFGRTFSDSVMATNGSYLENKIDIGPFDANGFVSKWNSSGIRLWSSYFPGDISSGFLRRNTLTFAGYTKSDTLVATPDARNPTRGSLRHFLASFTTSGQSIWGSYEGENRWAFGYKCHPIGDYGIALIGTTGSDSGIVANGQGVLPYNDAVLIMLEDDCIGSGPSNLALLDIGDDQAIISWTALNLLNQQVLVEYGPTGFVLGTGITDTLNPILDTIKNLNPETTYDVVIYEIRPDGSLTCPSDRLEIQTRCSSSGIPFLEDFLVWPPLCWNYKGTLVDPAHNGNDYVEFYKNGKSILTSPSIFLWQSAEVSFKWSHYYDVTFPYDSLILRVRELYSQDWDTLIVLRGTSFSSPSAGSISPGFKYDFQEEIILLTDSSYLFKEVEFELVYVGDGFSNCYIDEFNVNDFQICLPPTNLTALAIDDTSMALSWNQGSFMNFNWLVEYGPAGFSPGNGTVRSVFTTSDTIGGLDACTNYDFYVREICMMMSDTSAYGNPLSANTTCSSCTDSFDATATPIGNYSVRFDWNTTGSTSFAIYLRAIGESTWQNFLTSSTSRVLQNRAPGDYEFFIADLSTGDSSCIDTFSIQCATDITYTFNAFQAPEMGRLGRVRVFGTQGGKRLYDIHLVDDQGDSNSVFNVRQRNFSDLTDGNYSLFVRDDFGCEAASIGQFTINAMDTNFIPNLINAPNNPPNGFRPTWHSVDGVINYQLRVVNVTDGTLQLFQTGINDTMFAVTNLPTGKLYRFNVRSRYNNGSANVVSGYSNAVSRNLLVSGNKGETSSNTELATSIHLNIYPNPTNGLLYVQAPEGSTLTLIDMNGKAIAQRTAKGTEEIMDLTELAQGVYLLQINNEGLIHRERVMKK